MDIKMDVTFDALQREFYTLWDKQKVLPNVVTISESDYEAFAFSVVLLQEFSACERELLGEQRIAELDISEQRKRIISVINHVNGGMVTLRRDATLPSGTMRLDLIRTGTIQ